MKCARMCAMEMKEARRVNTKQQSEHQRLCVRV